MDEVSWLLTSVASHHYHCKDMRATRSLTNPENKLNTYHQNGLGKFLNMTIACGLKSRKPNISRTPLSSPARLRVLNFEMASKNVKGFLTWDRASQLVMGLTPSC